MEDVEVRSYVRSGRMVRGYKRRVRAAGGKASVGALFGLLNEAAESGRVAPLRSRQRGLELLAALEAAGWTIKRDGKRSVATSPDGKVVTLRLPKVEPESASSRPMDA